jgi:hypothetical protein
LLCTGQIAGFDILFSFYIFRSRNTTRTVGCSQPFTGVLIHLHRLRDNVDFDASLMGDDGRVCMKLSKNGKLYVTTIRMVFVVSNPDINSDFCSFDIPLSNVRGEQFNQPIFGCNNLSGTCLPLPGFSGSISWIIAFKSGGVGRLLSVLQDLLVRNRSGRPEAPEGELILLPLSYFHSTCSL